MHSPDTEEYKDLLFSFLTFHPLQLVATLKILNTITKTLKQKSNRTKEGKTSSLTFSKLFHRPFMAFP